MGSKCADMCFCYCSKRASAAQEEDTHKAFCAAAPGQHGSNGPSGPCWLAITYLQPHLAKHLLLKHRAMHVDSRHKQPVPAAQQESCVAQYIVSASLSILMKAVMQSQDIAVEQ